MFCSNAKPLRYEGRDKTARFIQFAARFIVGLLTRVSRIQPEGVIAKSWAMT